MPHPALAGGHIPPDGDVAGPELVLELVAVQHRGVNNSGEGQVNLQV